MMMPTKMAKSCLQGTVVTAALMLLLLCKHGATEVEAYQSTYFGAGDCGSEEDTCDVESIGMALKRLTPMPMSSSSSSSFNSKASSPVSSEWRLDDEDDENYKKSKRRHSAVFLPTTGQFTSYEEQDSYGSGEENIDDDDDFYNDQRGLRPKSDSSPSSSSSDDLGKGKRRKFRKGRGKGGGKGRKGKDGKSSKKSKRDTVNCSPVIEQFSSIIAIEFIGDKAAVSDSEKAALELTLVDAYNEIQETRCDNPNFRTCEVAEIQVVRDGSSDTVFQYLFEVEGTCRGTGCSTNQQFFSDAVEPITITRRTLRDLRGSDECDCPEDPDGFGAPSATEFGSVYFIKVQELRQALVLLNIDSSARVQEVSVTLPTAAPVPTNPPTPEPTPTEPEGTEVPSQNPSETPSFVPSISLQPSESNEPSSQPSGSSAPSESFSPSNVPSFQPSEVPSQQPSGAGPEPTESPSESPAPSFVPSSVPSVEPSESSNPSNQPSDPVT